VSVDAPVPGRSEPLARGAGLDHGALPDRSGWRAPIGGAVVLWIAARVLVTGTAVVSQFFEPNHGLLRSGSGWFFRLFFNWDSAYYLSIAQHGYSSDASGSITRAFFPGYGLAARVVALAIDPGGPGRGAFVVALWLVSAVASLGAAVLIWRLAEDQYGHRAAIAATALFLAGPYSLFLAASYAESLFLVLALGAWSCGTRQRWLAAGLLCGLASSVRPNGIMLFGALFVMYVTQRRASGRPILSGAFAAMMVGISGAAGYFAYLFVQTGSLTAWTEAQQQGWDRVTQWPWLTFYQTAGRVIYASTLDRRIQYGLDIVFAAILLAGVVYFWRAKHWPAFTYLGLTALSLMTSFTYVSLARNSLLMFPLTIAVASMVDSPRRRPIFWVSFVAGIVLLLFNVHQFTLGLWAD
jgi:Gpi18-like mannosyltransferase